MKRVSFVWLLLAFIAGVSGFAVGTSHNRPRLAVNQYSLDLLMESPDSMATTDNVTTPNDCNNDTKPDTPWDIMNCRFTYYKEVKQFPYVKETWNIKEIIPQTQQHKKVSVFYNTVTDEVVLVCRKLKCEQ